MKKHNWVRSKGGYFCEECGEKLRYEYPNLGMPRPINKDEPCEGKPETRRPAD